jgi:hypothetical protein
MTLLIPVNNSRIKNKYITRVNIILYISREIIMNIIIYINNNNL